MKQRLLAAVLVSGAACFAAHAVAQDASAPAGAAIDMAPICGARTPPRFYPQRALDHLQDGSAEIDCAIDTATSKLTICTIVSETPAGWGFGEAALGMACRLPVDAASVRGPAGTRSYQTPSGQSRARIPVTFHLQH